MSQMNPKSYKSCKMKQNISTELLARSFLKVYHKNDSPDPPRLLKVHGKGKRKRKRKRKRKGKVQTGKGFHGKVSTERFPGKGFHGKWSDRKRFPRKGFHGKVLTERFSLWRNRRLTCRGGNRFVTGGIRKFD